MKSCDIFPVLYGFLLSVSTVHQNRLTYGSLVQCLVHLRGLVCVLKMEIVLFCLLCVGLHFCHILFRLFPPMDNELLSIGQRNLLMINFEMFTFTDSVPLTNLYIDVFNPEHGGISMCGLWDMTRS